MIREMFEDMPILSSIIAIIIAAFGFLLIDTIASKPEVFYGNVIDKHYEAESDRTGTGVGVTSSGNTGVVFTSESEPEKFLLIVKTQSGKIVTIKCKPELYYEKEIGERIEFNAYKGLFTGTVWSNRGVR